MRRLKNIILILVIVLTLMLIGNINYHQVATDSGFDTGYDSGGSGGSSSWGSGGSGSHRSGSSSSGDPRMGAAIIIFVIVIIIVSVRSKNNNIININNYDINKIKAFIPNFDAAKFLQDRYGDFVNIQVSWMNFNYDNLRLKLTDELYNQYCMQLASLEAQNRKNIMNNFKMNSTKIIAFKCENNLATIKIELDVSFYDYITENGVLVRGNSNRKVNMVYYLTFVSRISGNTSECPHCGAPITSAASQTCAYCKCVISSVSSDWVLSKKEVISQR